ncbi:MAG: ATP phosphoribosyltransferase regulatory subunit [Henriciella sp.]|nr:ATP phosphoribosyltransferase regulatory subunit [Henriciella sp.]
MNDLFASLGGTFVEPRVVLEAALPLELSGEAVRGRICVFVDEDGREWALRPDLTLPVAVDEIEARRRGAEGERVVRYAAPVFRLPALPGDPVEFTQAGFERFGGTSGPVADASIFVTITGCCTASGVADGVVKLGDLSVFPAFVDAMGLPVEVAAGLKRAFRQEGGVRALLNATHSGAASGLALRMQGMNREQATAFVEDIFALTGIRPVGERTSDEIVERLHQRAKDGGAVSIQDETRTALEAVLDVDAAVPEAIIKLREIAETVPSGALAAVLDQLDARHAEMIRTAPEFMAHATFSTRFGRRFTYYDGFVFEIAASAAEQGRPFATGGRYDSLLSDLSGGDVSANAVGAIIIPHRLARATGGAG